MLIDALEGLWNTILDVTSLFVMPDWNGLIALLPVLIFLGVVGPLVTFFVLGLAVYQARKPRVKVAFEEGPRTAELDADGRPVFPPGLPYCRRDALVYPSGTTRCEVCRDELAVTCPMCGVGRAAELDTCGNCGLVLRIENRGLAVRRGRPKPGGAAVA
ncbi:MAG TPA: hypothetical protein VLA44_10525 [Clostridia bacterium]|nr:hypothetical protein [Clostridia bacterium]